MADPSSPPLQGRSTVRRRLRRWAFAGAGAALVGLLSFAAFAWRPSLPEVATPAPSSFRADVVARGATLAAAGYCSECHTVKGGQPFAGGYAMKSGFGTIYSTNITPDRKTALLGARRIRWTKVGPGTTEA